MAIIPIQPANIKTDGGLDATITGINTSSTDCIVGTIQTVSGPKEVSWDKSGICRDNHPDCNLDPHSNEVMDAVDAVRPWQP